MQALERNPGDGWRCQFCGSQKNLQVHHKEFRSQSGHDSEQNLITLCSDCHLTLHGRHSSGLRGGGKGAAPPVGRASIALKKTLSLHPSRVSLRTTCN